ncbi:MAG TPA: hypothetical protein VGL61_08275 [Kofleriaceae bacterium]|jgi:hypothetical protein
MRTFAFVVGLAMSLGACSGSAPPSQPDASGGACTKALYDPCATEHDCTSGNCQTFNDASGLEVCTEPCSASGSACPNDSSGAAGTCDSTLLLCRPAKANACTLAP